MEQCAQDLVGYRARCPGSTPWHSLPAAPSEKGLEGVQLRNLAPALAMSQTEDAHLVAIALSPQTFLQQDEVQPGEVFHLNMFFKRLLGPLWALAFAPWGRQCISQSCSALGPLVLCLGSGLSTYHLCQDIVSPVFTHDHVSQQSFLFVWFFFPFFWIYSFWLLFQTTNQYFLHPLYGNCVFATWANV